MKTNNKIKTIAQQLNVTDFPFVINDKNGNEIYWENSNGDWCRKEYDSYGNETRYENSKGFIEDRGPKDGVAEINTTKGIEHSNPLTNPSEHTLQELFAELKFGRPSANQEYLDKCIAELNEQEGTTTTNNFYLPNVESIKTPNYVGGYRLGGESGLQINFTYKPNWFHRTMMRLCFVYMYQGVRDSL